ncbi:MAG TPA: SAM-dependent methyltransferase [Polyangiaceae bacterium]|jgi:predicted methyltransferase
MTRTTALGLLVLAAAACGGSQTSTQAPVAAAPAPSASAPAPVATAPEAVAAPPAASNGQPKIVTQVDVPPATAAIVAASDRSDEDKKLDAGRHPGEMLAFFGIAPGMRVGEIAAAGGYTTELLARAVGANGVVYAENPKFILERYAQKPFSARLAKPVNAHVVRSDREPSDPFPPEAHDLDVVVDVLFYHDTVWLGVDRDAMNAAIFRALKHGGVYGIIDHAAKDGSGTNDVKTTHRIEERVVREEVEKAGFRLDSKATFLANPSDTRDWNDSPMAAGAKRGTSDRFVLKFVKP